MVPARPRGWNAAPRAPLVCFAIPAVPAPCLPPACPVQATRLLSIVWGGALVGMAQCLFFAHAPKALAAGLYVALGWAALPFLQRFHAVLPDADVALIVGGGVIYSLGVSSTCCWLSAWLFLLAFLPGWAGCCLPPQGFSGLVRRGRGRLRRPRPAGQQLRCSQARPLRPLRAKCSAGWT